MICAEIKQANSPEAVTYDTSSMGECFESSDGRVHIDLTDNVVLLGDLKCLPLVVYSLQIRIVLNRTVLVC